jgi:tetratricopeptide (TPR) repeat protein
MKRRASAAVCVATVAGCLLAVSAPAQTQQDWALCQDHRSPDFPIQGCTAVIRTGRQLLDRLAIAYNNRGVAYRLKTEYDKAIDDFNEAIKLRPNYPNALNNRAVAYRNKGDLDHALADYDQAIALKPIISPRTIIVVSPSMIRANTNEPSPISPSSSRLTRTIPSCCSGAVRRY